MPIKSQDIIIFKSDTMTQAPEGGGAISGEIVVDGQSNNIFDDISTLDRVYGSVNLSKVFPAVYTQTDEPFFGSHAILSKLPGDEKIGVNLFTSGDYYDRREAAQFRVENYRIQGGTYLGFLLGTQYAGSKVVTIFQGVDKPVLGVGDVLYLTQSNNQQNQYIRVRRITESVQEFFDGNTIYLRRILNIEISQVLEFDFVGVDIARNDNLNPPAKIRTTVVPNAARYYSTRPLAEDAAPGDLFVRADTIYSQIVPSSNSETAITDADANGYATTLTDSANSNVTFSFEQPITGGGRLYLGRPCKPGSLNINAGGVITDSNGDVRVGGITIGTIDYGEGIITWSPDSPTYNGTKTVTFRPSAAPVTIADTAFIAVTDQNRGFVWTHTMTPTPRPGTVRISFMALGNWYTLQDNVNGSIKGIDQQVGAGSVNYATGTLSVTLDSMPDIDTAIVITWGVNGRYYNRASITPEPVTFRHKLSKTGITPQTLTVAWNDGTARTLTADIHGNLTGHGTGHLQHTTGDIEFSPATLPLGGTSFEFSYQHGEPQTVVFNQPFFVGGSDDELLLDLGAVDVLPNTIELDWNVFVTIDPEAQNVGILPGNRTYVAVDNGAGALTGVAGSVVNYSAGTIKFKPERQSVIPVPIKHWIGTGQFVKTVGWYTTKEVKALRVTGFSLQNKVMPFPQDGSGKVTVKFRSDDSSTQITESAAINQIIVKLQNGFAESIIPGSLRFRIGSQVYVDRNGLLYSDVDPLSGAGIFAGNIDYSTGTAILQTWQSGVGTTVTLESMATQIGRHVTSSIQFRVPVSPVRPLSLQLRATPVDGGGQIEISADASGYIGQAEAQGFIDYATGLVSVQFGEYVTAAGNEAEGWYDPAFIDEGQIFKPAGIYADTVVYNVVTQAYLPLDGAILGLNPVRLPQDGRIPVYAQGDVVVILHDKSISGTYSNAQTVDLGRTRLSKVVVRDSAANPITTDKFTVDLDAGTITFVDLSGVSQPLSIIDRIEDMAVCTDAQITGKLTLSQPITHTFPANETMVASAVIFSDLFARTSIPFDQQTWTGEWSDQRIGNDSSGEFNFLLNPIIVTNASTIQEKWRATFVSATTVNITGKGIGQIVTGASIAGDIEPINPNTGDAYFKIKKESWGAGWSGGNVVRFNTFSANVPLWIIQSIAQGEPTSEDLNFTLEFRGDVDAP